MPDVDEHIAYVATLSSERVDLLRWLRKPRAQWSRHCSDARGLRELDEFVGNTLDLPRLGPAHRVSQVAFPGHHGKVARDRVRDDGYPDRYAFAVLQRELEAGGVLRMILAEAWSTQVAADAMGRGVGVRVGGREIRSAVRISAVVERPEGPILVLLRARWLPREEMFDVLATARAVCSTALLVMEDLEDAAVFARHLEHVPVVVPAFRAARLAPKGSVYGAREFASRLVSVTNLLMRHRSEIPLVLCDEPATQLGTSAGSVLHAAVDASITTAVQHDRLPATRLIVNRVQGARPSFVTTMSCSGPSAEALARVLQLLEEPAAAVALRSQRRRLAQLLEGDALQSSVTATHDLYATTVAGHLATQGLAA